MKKKLALLTTGLLLWTISVASAAAMWGTYKGYDIVRLQVDGHTIQVTDAPAINFNNRTMIPIYMLKDAGISYSWDRANSTVNILSNASNSSNKDTIITLIDYYQSLERTGREIIGVSGTSQTLLNHYLYGTDSYTEMSVVKYILERSIDTYTQKQGQAQEMIDLASSIDYPYEKIESILNLYSSSIENFKTSLQYLEKLSVEYSETDYDLYNYYREKAETQNLDGQERAYTSYLGIIAMAPYL